MKVYKFGNTFCLLPNLYYICTQIWIFMNVCKKQILEYARSNQKVNATVLASAFGMKPVTVRQYLCALVEKLSTHNYFFLNILIIGTLISCAKCPIQIIFITFSSWLTYNSRIICKFASAKTSQKLKCSIYLGVMDKKRFFMQTIGKCLPGVLMVVTLLSPSPGFCQIVHDSKTVMERFLAPDAHAKPMARMWFPDASAESSSQGSRRLSGWCNHYVALASAAQYYWPEWWSCEQGVVVQCNAYNGRRYCQRHHQAATASPQHRLPPFTTCKASVLAPRSAAWTSSVERKSLSSRE